MEKGLETAKNAHVSIMFDHFRCQKRLTQAIGHAMLDLGNRFVFPAPPASYGANSASSSSFHGLFMVF